MGRTSQIACVLTLPAVLALACGGQEHPKTPEVAQQDCRGGKVWHKDDSVRFRGCETVEGDLALGGALESADDFSALRVVRGDMVLGPSYQLNSLAALSGLQRVQGSVRVLNNMGLAGLFLGALKHIGGALQVEGNIQLRTVSLHHVEVIGGVLSLGEANRVLERVDLSRLRKLDGAELQIDWQKGRPESLLRAPLY